MWGYLTYRVARRALGTLRQEESRCSAPAPEKFDYERYQRVTDEQNKPLYVNVVEMFKAGLGLTVVGVILKLAWLDSLSWWTITAPVWATLVLAACCNHYKDAVPMEDDNDE